MRVTSDTSPYKTSGDAPMTIDSSPAAAPSTSGSYARSDDSRHPTTNEGPIGASHGGSALLSGADERRLCGRRPRGVVPVAGTIEAAQRAGRAYAVAHHPTRHRTASPLR